MRFWARAALDARNLPGAPKGVNHLIDVGEEPNPRMRLAFTRFMTAPIVVSFLMPTLGEAQSIPSPFTYLEERQEFGPFSGRMSANTGRFDYGPEGGLLMGVRYGLELSGPLAIEGLVGFADGSRNVVDPGRVEGDRVIGQADALMTMIDARIRFSFPGRRAWKKLSPFLVFGGGLALDAASTSDLDDTLLAEDRFEFGTSFFGTAGLGTRWFVTDRFTLRGDGIFSLWKVDTPPGYADPARGFLGVGEGEWLQATSFQIALLYRW